MKTLLFSLLVVSWVLFLQAGRYVQVNNWHLVQRKCEVQHKYNTLRLKYDTLRQYTIELEGKQ
jgi:hypothetical protein